MNCPHYRVTEIAGPTIHAIGQQPFKAPGTRAPWCNHANSHVPEMVATQTIGGHQVLKCGGNLQHCSIPPHER